MNWRNSNEARAERLAQRNAPPPVTLPPNASPDLRHCFAVVRANGGKSFPFYQEQAA